MSTAPVSLGLVGCGRLARSGYVPALRLVPGVRLVAVADPEPGRRAEVASDATAAGCGPPDGGPVTRHHDAASLLADAAVDGLVLASPAAAHVADAERAAAARIPTLVEKPPAPDAPGAARLVALAPPPRVAFNRRFDPGAAAVRAAVPPAGDVHLDLALSYRRRGWGSHAVHDDALTDLGPHLVDWARWITGSEVVAVACTELTPDRATLDLTLDRGRATVRAAADRPHAELVELSDGRGRLLARHRLGGLVAGVRGRLGRTGPSTLVTTLAGQLGEFAVTCRGGDAPTLGTAHDGLAAMLVVDAARASAADRGRRRTVTSTGAH